MRTTFLVLVLCGAALAAPQAQTTTYVDGNLAGLTPKTGGTLAFDDEKTMHLRTGLTTVAVPYAGVSHAELGAVKEESSHEPLYKFWERRHRTETQLLIVNFKDEQGEEKTMTLELARPAAQSVMTDLETHTGKTFIAKGNSPTPKMDPMATVSPEVKRANWWGDDYWKTSNNAEKWAKPAAASDQSQKSASSDQNQKSGSNEQNQK